MVVVGWLIGWLVVLFSFVFYFNFGWVLSVSVIDNFGLFIYLHRGEVPICMGK